MPEVRALDPTSYEAHVLHPPPSPGPASPSASPLSSPSAGSDDEPRSELSWAEWFAWAPLVLLTLAVGVLPALILGDTLQPLTTLLGVHR